MTISNGGSVSVLGSGERDFIVGNSSTGSGTHQRQHRWQHQRIVVRRWQQRRVGDGDDRRRSTVSLDGVVYPPNLVPVGAGVRVGRGVGANGTLNLQNGAIIDVHNTTAGSNVILGGTSVLPGGTGTLNMSSGSAINFTGPAAGASLQIGGVTGAGGSGGTGTITMTGNSVVNLGATGQVFVGGNAGTSGTLTIASASAWRSMRASEAIGGNSDTVAGGNGTAAVPTGAGSALNAIGVDGFMSVGRSGSGTLNVNSGGTVSATVMNIGRATGGVGTLSVNNGVLNLSGQQQTTGIGAALSLGNQGGTGSATVTNGSVVTISNAGTGGASLNTGGTPLHRLGIGTLDVSGSQINLVAAPGLAIVRVGYDGTGTTTLAGSALNVGNVSTVVKNPVTGSTQQIGDGAVIIAGQPGSTGTLVLNAGSVVNAGFVGIGVSQPAVVIGGVVNQVFNGGNGHLILDHSTVNTTTFEIGAGGLLSGDGGVINALGNVIVGGTISPGYSPGRININCDFITLPGSKLILDISGHRRRLRHRSSHPRQRFHFRSHQPADRLQLPR